MMVSVVLNRNHKQYDLKLRTDVKSDGFTSGGMKVHLSTVLEQHPLQSQNVTITASTFSAQIISVYCFVLMHQHCYLSNDVY